MVENITIHSQWCETSAAFWKLLDQQFTNHWPNHCKTCYGRGGSVYEYDPSPAGVGLSPGTMEEFEPCPDCVEQGQCPRCGQREESLFSDEPLVCPHCSWNSEIAELHVLAIETFGSASLLSELDELPNTQELSDIVFHAHAIPLKPECYCGEV